MSSDTYARRQRWIFSIGIVAGAIGIYSRTRVVEVICGLTVLWAGAAAVALVRALRPAEDSETAAGNETAEDIPSAA